MNRMSITIFIVFIIFIILSSCVFVSNPKEIQGSGILTKQEKSFTDFNSLNICSDFNVIVEKGTEYQVVIEADDNLWEYLEIELYEDTLILNWDRDFQFKENTFNAFIKMPDIKKIETRNDSIVKLDEEFILSDNSIELNLYNSSMIEGAIQAKKIDILMKNSSYLKLEGKSKELNLDLSIKAEADLLKFKSEKSKINAKNSSRVYLLSPNELDLFMKNSSYLKLEGKGEELNMNLLNSVTVDISDYNGDKVNIDKKHSSRVIER
ncbi:DUF2807 domain-containing protein [Herbivorax sp. ANBcel31]|uniref:GIN domain-containing protein n=1 Tax=Herbivorax sp. ANBcel31 TaxID=3069754 RepID=UPI0027B6D1E4|nr:DUF2807 domain-containing protein [Herbivorax sp. ANBcel31]MDQ2087768.1 DUF2807 domain-containing protein [Herbivorax sp. ANBcel31]